MAQKFHISVHPGLDFSSNAVDQKTIPKTFGQLEDSIEVHIYDQTGRLLTSIPNFTDFGKLGDTNLTNELNLDPVSILNSNGYLNGKYKITFNILRKKIFNTSDKLFTVKEISPTRTELKVVATSRPAFLKTHFGRASLFSWSTAIL